MTNTPQARISASQPGLREAPSAEQHTQPPPATPREHMEAPPGNRSCDTGVEKLLRSWRPGSTRERPRLLLHSEPISSALHVTLRSDKKNGLAASSPNLPCDWHVLYLHVLFWGLLRSNYAGTTLHTLSSAVAMITCSLHARAPCVPATPQRCHAQKLFGCPTTRIAHTCRTPQRQHLQRTMKVRAIGSGDWPLVKWPASN